MNLKIIQKIKQKYYPKYKIFRPYLKTYLKKRGYFSGYYYLFKTVMVNGLRSIYHQLINSEEPYINILIDMSPIKYLIYAPDFVSNSAGIYCLYKLCHDLQQKGIPAAIYGSNVTPHTLDAPLITENSMKLLQKRGDVWVVYPETIRGNPLNFKNIVRWVLNRPGILGGDEVYHHDEKVFVYSNVYMPYVQNIVQGKLCPPTFDNTIFYPPPEGSSEKERGLACYYVGKSTFKPGYFDVTEAFEITRTSPVKYELGKLFRAAKVLYCFDNSTALIYEAIACGCPVQIIPDGTQTWDDYMKLEWGTTGIFWDRPVENLTREDVNALLNKIKITESNYQMQLDHFIQETCGAIEFKN